MSQELKDRTKKFGVVVDLVERSTIVTEKRRKNGSIRILGHYGSSPGHGQAKYQFFAILVHGLAGSVAGSSVNFAKAVRASSISWAISFDVWSNRDRMRWSSGEASRS